MIIISISPVTNDIQIILSIRFDKPDIRPEANKYQPAATRHGSSPSPCKKAPANYPLSHNRENDISGEKPYLFFDYRMPH